MSLKSLVQLVILIIIFIILGSVYFKYFSDKNKNGDFDTVKILDEKDTKIINKENIKKDLNILENSDTEKNMNSEISLNDQEVIFEKEFNENQSVKNLTKNIEYITTDQKGNGYKIIASSGRSNPKNKNILDLIDVKGEITSKERSTIYIKSDFAQYNSLNLGSKFFKNVVIEFEDKKITCYNFDINMESNSALAYNNVVVTDTNSKMKAGKITLDFKTKEINIGIGDNNNKVLVITK